MLTLEWKTANVRTGTDEVKVTGGVSSNRLVSRSLIVSELHQKGTARSC